MTLNKTVIFAITQKKAEEQLSLMAERIEQFETIISRRSNIIETSERRYEAHRYSENLSRSLRYSVVCIHDELLKDDGFYNDIVAKLRPDVPLGVDYDWRKFVFVFK